MINYTKTLTELITHITESMPEFSFIEPEKLIVNFSLTRTPGVYGTYAAVRPLRFEDGSTIKTAGKRKFRAPDVIINDTLKLYVINFYMPRFLNLGFDEKITTVFHELYHISPLFNGDIRRFPGKNYAHGHSCTKFNEVVKVFAEKYLTLPGASETADFLRYNHNQLIERYEKVICDKFYIPKPALIKD